MIFHIFGGQCSGKTSVVEHLDPKQFVHWDILQDFYIPQGIMINSEMIWDNWKHREHLLERELNKFLKANADKRHIIIESSGLNKRINAQIKQYSPIIPINMGIPNWEETKERAKARGLNPKAAGEFNMSITSKYERILDYLPKQRTVTEAVLFIKEQINGGKK